MPNHYEVLGLTRAAKPSQVRAAYRSLARKHHPDVSKEPDAGERFVRINEAYEVLSDPERRNAYDQILDKHANAAAAEQRRREQARARPKTAAPPQSRVDPAQLLEMNAMLNRHRLADAERLARLVIAVDSRQPMAYAVLADVARFRGDIATAAKYYAYAAQYDGGNPVYERKHEEMLTALSARQAGVAHAQTDQKAPTALWVGLFLIGIMACYSALANEPPLAPKLPMISTWTLAQVAMLLLAGVSAGASLACAGLMESFGVGQSAALTRVPPSLVLGGVALLNFWLATAIYVMVGTTQEAFNASTSRLIGAAAVVALVFAFAATTHTSQAGLQTLFWGGNVAYIGALGGWFVTDSLRRAA